MRRVPAGKESWNSPRHHGRFPLQTKWQRVPDRGRREFQKVSAPQGLDARSEGAEAAEACNTSHNTTGSRYVPKISCSAIQISPKVAFALTASIK